MTHSARPSRPNRRCLTARLASLAENVKAHRNNPVADCENFCAYGWVRTRDIRISNVAHCKLTVDRFAQDAITKFILNRIRIVANFIHLDDSRL